MLVSKLEYSGMGFLRAKASQLQSPPPGEVVIEADNKKRISSDQLWTGIFHF